MQFFLFTPPLIWIYKKSPFAGWVFIGLYTILGIITAGAVAHHFDLNVSIIGPHHWAYNNYYNNKPYIRLPPYVFGIGAGFIYFTSTTNNEDNISNFFIKLYKNTIFRFANLALGITLWLVAINVQFNVYEHPGRSFDYKEWSHDKNAAYLALIRLVLAIAYSSMFTPMVLGYFSSITTILSSQIWVPFSRLTFCVYLVHTAVIDVFMRSLQYPKYLNKTNLYVEFISFFMVSYFFAAAFAVFIDIPVKTLILMGFGKKESKEPYYEIND